jgi:glycosyltransferase involved in cell wall biosynthesis
MLVSIIIITLNEAEYIQKTIEKARFAAQFPSGNINSIEIIVSDGGSTDGTQEIAKKIADHLIVGPSGRFRQLNKAAEFAKGDILLFLHADAILPKGAISQIFYRLQNPNIIGGGFKKYWNWNPKFERSPFLKFICFWWQGLGNWLVRLLRTFPGDNAIFVRKSIYQELNGYKPLWICEDLDFSRRLKKYGKKRFIYIRSAVLTSTRRFEKSGFFSTILTWFSIYWLWRLGMSQWRLKTKFKNYL